VRRSTSKSKRRCRWCGDAAVGYRQPIARQAEMFEPALEKNSCQQRGVQSLQFECKFNLADGPQSLIVVPEDTGSIPHKKAKSRCSL